MLPSSFGSYVQLPAGLRCCAGTPYHGTSFSHQPSRVVSVGGPDSRMPSLFRSTTTWIVVAPSV